MWLLRVAIIQFVVGRVSVIANVDVGGPVVLRSPRSFLWRSKFEGSVTAYGASSHRKPSL
jgi:hypothetical protein